MPALKGSGRGDLLVEVQVETPTKLSSAQEKALKAFAESLKDSNLPEVNDFRKRASRFLK